MIQPHHISRLFDELWPGMYASAAHRSHCLTILPQLEACFRKWDNGMDNLLDCLAGLDGIGLTIASGLIWSVFPRKAVPFDKWTMTYALQNRLLNNHKISGGGYSRACRAVVGLCDASVYVKANGNERRYKVKDFVRYALQEANGYEWSIGPI